MQLESQTAFAIGWSLRRKSWEKLGEEVQPNSEFGGVKARIVGAGANWQEEIKGAIASTKVAVLLISVDYLASELVVENELPPLLAASEEEGVTILPIILGPCNFKYTNLAHFQTVNDPSIPLSKMNKHDKDEVWNKVVETILESR